MFGVSTKNLNDDRSAVTKFAEYNLQPGVGDGGGGLRRSHKFISLRSASFASDSPNCGLGRISPHRTRGVFLIESIRKQ